MKVNFKKWFKIYIINEELDYRLNYGLDYRLNYIIRIRLQTKLCTRPKTVDLTID